MVGPPTWVPPEELSLEIDGMAWRLTRESGGGVITPSLTDVVEVRLRGVPSCHRYATFEAGPGTAHVIAFKPDESVTVSDPGRQAQLERPTLAEGEPSGCPD